MVMVPSAENRGWPGDEFVTKLDRVPARWFRQVAKEVEIVLGFAGPAH